LDIVDGECCAKDKFVLVYTICKLSAKQASPSQGISGLNVWLLDEHQDSLFSMHRSEGEAHTTFSNPITLALSITRGEQIPAALTAKGRKKDPRQGPKADANGLFQVDPCGRKLPNLLPVCLKNRWSRPWENDRSEFDSHLGKISGRLGKKKAERFFRPQKSLKVDFGDQ